MKSLDETFLGVQQAGFANLFKVVFEKSEFHSLKPESLYYVAPHNLNTQNNRVFLHNLCKSRGS